MHELLRAPRSALATMVALLSACTSAGPSPQQQCQRIAEHLSTLSMSEIQAEIDLALDEEGSKQRLARDLDSEAFARQWPALEQNFARLRAQRLALVRAEVDAKTRAFKTTCVEELTTAPARAKELPCLEAADHGKALERCSAYDML